MNAHDKTDFDGAYHRIFSQPEVVKDLVRRFLPPEVSGVLDLARLQRESAKLYAEGLHRRDGDVVYRVGLKGGGDAWLLLMLEFQSSPDRWMAVRVLTYAGLLWQQWIAQEKPGRGGRLPPVFPVVLYNGEGAWWPGLSVSSLLDLPPGHPVAPWQPEASYYLLDEARTHPRLEEEGAGLCALLLALEQCQTPEELDDLLERLITLLQRDDLQGLRDIARAFIAFITEVLTPRGLHITDQHIQHIHEAKPMLKQTVERWRQELAVQHQEIGEARGKEIGKEIGELRSLLRLFQRAQGREASGEEQELLAALLRDEGLEAAMDLLLDTGPDALLARLRGA